MSPDDLKRRFGLRVLALRRQLGMTQEQLAEAIGKSTYTVSNIENGRLSTRIETASRLSEVLGVSLSELFDIADVRPATDREHRRALEDLVRSTSKLAAHDVEQINKMVQLMLSFRGKA